MRPALEQRSPKSEARSGPELNCCFGGILEVGRGGGGGDYKRTGIADLSTFLKLASPETPKTEDPNGTVSLIFTTRTDCQARNASTSSSGCWGRLRGLPRRRLTSAQTQLKPNPQNVGSRVKSAPQTSNENPKHSC